MKNWMLLEAELTDILYSFNCPLEYDRGETWIVDYDLDGNSYRKLSIMDLARELDARGVHTTAHAVSVTEDKRARAVANLSKLVGFDITDDNARPS